MPKIKSVYICQACGYQAPNWNGQCRECGQWNTFVETAIDTSSKIGQRHASSGFSITPKRVSEIKTTEVERATSNISEFDRVLGGGFVPGQVVLLAGTPGIGKSTLLTQIAKSLHGTNVLYVGGEESMSQIKVRTNRMKYDGANLFLLSETDVDLITSSINEISKEYKLGLIIVDSIQTIFSRDLTGMAGSVGQVRGGTAKIIDIAKSLGIPTILVGHVTKEGTVAGPMVLEHMVDTILYLEGDSNHLYRILKTSKNRFGPVSEVGIFEMSELGMTEVLNASDLFLGSDNGKASGSCVTVVMEGYRPLLFEIQALTVKTSFGYPKRTASGYSINRLHVLIATLEKRCGLRLSDYDVYLSVSGGYKVSEYSCDLAVCLALASSINEKPIKIKTVAYGECDLSGGVRKVPFQDIRSKEAKKLGYKNIISPQNVSTIKEALACAF